MESVEQFDRLFPFRLDQVPFIAVQIEKHHHPAVGLAARLLGEAHTFCLHITIGFIKIWSVQEESHPTTSLVADMSSLLERGGFGEQQARATRPGRRDHHPALAAALRGVFAQREAQRAGEEGDGFIVLAHEQGDERK